MSVLGLDIGNENCVVAVAKQRGIDVILNDESNRETPAMVCFGDKQRFIGTAAAASATLNPKTTISQIKRLIGRKFHDLEEHDLRLFPFQASETPDGGIHIHVQYLGKERTFTPTEILGMLLSHLKAIAVKNLETSAISDCVIGIPAYFTELQRQAYLDAASIANLNPRRLLHESTAIALAYGIYKTDLSDISPIYVVFVDVGHSDTQVCVAAFFKGHLKIFSHAFDRSLGGRDFDEVLFNYFVKKFREDYGIDVTTNPRASIRMRAACEKLKKVLSANAEAPLNIECLMDEKDVRGFIKRDDFEKLSSNLLEKLKVPCQRALDEAQLSVDRIHSVEVVGSGSRIPAILRTLSSLFKKEPSRTLNASECIARGCALQCAMLSPTFRVRDFQVEDSFPFSIALRWEGPALTLEADEGCVPIQSNDVIFPKGNPIPSNKMLTFYRASTFSLAAVYADMKDLPPGMSPEIGSFTIGPFKAHKPEKIKVNIRLNLHGTVTVESAILIEEEEVEYPSMSTAMIETEKNKDGGNMPDPSADASIYNAVNGHAAPTGCTSPATEHSQAELTKRKVVMKRSPRRTVIPVTADILGGLSQFERQEAIGEELYLANQDKIMEETKDKKNALESYVYDMRNKLFHKYNNYAMEYERQKLSQELQWTEDWLYEEGDDVSKEEYVKKLDELKRIGDLIEQRYKEDETRTAAANDLLHNIYEGRKAAILDDLETKDKDKIILELNKAEAWLREERQRQDAIPKWEKPILLSSDIRKKFENLDRFRKSILTKTKRAPPKPSPKAGNAKDSKQNTSSGGEQSSEPMDTDQPQDPESMQTD